MGGGAYRIYETNNQGDTGCLLHNVYGHPF